MFDKYEAVELLQSLLRLARNENHQKADDYAAALDEIKSISRSSRPFACIFGDLCAEILYWRFLDEWKDCLPWRSEHHLTVSLYSDASSRSWGAVLIQDSQRLVSRDYWSTDSSEDINVLDSKVLLNALVAFRTRLSNSRVDVHIDSRVLKSALDGDGCKNSAINDVVKNIFRHSRDFNFSIHTFYVPSSRNPADEPSRNLSDLDRMLTPKTWLCLERCFGPHSFDLMSLDSKCQRDRSGNPLPHFTPWPTPGSAGVNVFANSFLLVKTFTFFRLLSSSVHSFVTYSVKIPTMRSLWSFLTFARDPFGGHTFRL